MKRKADALRRLASLNLSPQAMAEVLNIIADMTAADDDRRAKDRERKRRVRGNSADNPRTETSVSAEIPRTDDTVSAENPRTFRGHSADIPRTEDAPRARVLCCEDIYIPSTSLRSVEGPPKPKNETPRKAENGSERGTYLPADWQPRPQDGLNPTEARKFRDYWAAKAGPSAKKRNWDAAWRNWLEKAREYGQQQRGRPQRDPEPSPIVRAAMNVAGTLK